MKIRNLAYLPFLFLSVSCGQKGLDIPKESCPVLVSFDTKAGEEERTYRVGLFDVASNGMYAMGTYCSKSFVYSTYSWLLPCLVNNDGAPLKSDGITLAANLTEAATGGAYGLRYGTTGTYNIAVSSPAKAFSVDESVSSRKYYPWTPSTELYLSGPSLVTLAGTWLNGEYVYTASSKEELALKDRRARIYVQIECGAQADAYIQSVKILNAVNSARWYVPNGFSATPEHYTTASPIALSDALGTPLAGNPLHLVRANSDVWKSTTELFIPAIDYSNGDVYTDMRPRIEVLLGTDLDHPARAVVSISENVEPMMNYTYYLYVSKSNVIISLTSSSWDSVPDPDVLNTTTESPCFIREISIDGWTANSGDTNTDDWNDSFE